MINKKLETSSCSAKGNGARNSMNINVLICNKTFAIKNFFIEQILIKFQPKLVLQTGS